MKLYIAHAQFHATQNKMATLAFGIVFSLVFLSLAKDVPEYRATINNDTIFLMKGNVKISVQDEKNSQEFIMPDKVNLNAKASNSSGPKNGNLSVKCSWEGNNLEFLFFADWVSKIWQLDELLFSFINSNLSVSNGTVMNTFTGGAYKTSLNQPYECGEITDELKAKEILKGTFKVDSFKLQVFTFDKKSEDVGFSASPNKCSGQPAQDNYIVPIVVGCLLFLLAVVAFTAYIIGYCRNRRKNRNYEIIQ